MEKNLDTSNVKIIFSSEKSLKESTNLDVQLTNSSRPASSDLIINKEMVKLIDLNSLNQEEVIGATQNSSEVVNGSIERNNVRNNVLEEISSNEAERIKDLSYKCGVCLQGFPDITSLHEHMINDEKVKGYKYNTEDKTASIVEGYDNKESKKTTGKKPGRKRKKESLDEDWSDGRYFEYVPIKVEVESDSEINEKSLVKFEKTIGAKRANSAFFDPVSHGYGTRRSSFLKLNDHTSPKKGEGKSKKKQKILNDKKVDQEGVDQTDRVAKESDQDVVQAETNVDIGEERLEEGEAETNKNVNKVEAQGNDIKPDGTQDIDLGIESDEVNSAEDDSDYDPSSPESDNDEPSDPESDPSWGGNNEKRKNREKATSNASYSTNKTSQKQTSRQSINHRRKTNDTKRYKCKTCGRILRSKINANRHRTLHLLKEENVEFEELEVSDIKIENVEKENTYNQVNDMVKAPDNRNVDTISNNEQEKASENTSIEFSCRKCEATFNDKKELKVHELTNHRRKVHKCDICQKIFAKLYRLEEHKDSVHSDETFECEICNTKLSTRRRLWAHKGCHLVASDKYYSEEVASKIREEYKARNENKTRPEFSKCDICGKEVVSKRLVRHMLSHNTSKDFECEICHKRFTNKRYVRDHIKKSHGNVTSTCDICGRTFKGTSYLEKHKQTHGPKDKICKICGRGFTTDFYLRIHMITHSEEKQFKCQYCQAAFKHKARLDIHVVERHTEGQDKPCKYCGELFPSRHKARLHERKIHEGHQPASTKPKQHTRMVQKVVKVQNVRSSKLKDADPFQNLPVTLKIDEEVESVEQIIEIPENSQQCQLMILPNGVIKVLNVIEEEPGSTVEEVEIYEKDSNNISVQYLSEDGNEVIQNGDAQIQYIEVDESEFNLLTQNKDPSTHIVEIVEPPSESK